MYYQETIYKTNAVGLCQKGPTTFNRLTDTAVAASYAY